MSYEYSDKMKENRDQWGSIGIIHTSLMVPEKYREYFKAVFAIMCGNELNAAIETHDPTILEMFSNRTPRFNFTEADVMLYMRDTENADARNDCQEILDAMLERKKYIQDARKAAADNDVLKAQYWFAKDYAMGFLIRGTYSLMQERIKGNVPDMKEYR